MDNSSKQFALQYFKYFLQNTWYKKVAPNPSQEGQMQKLIHQYHTFYQVTSNLGSSSYYFLNVT